MKKKKAKKSKAPKKVAKVTKADRKAKWASKGAAGNPTPVATQPSDSALSPQVYEVPTEPSAPESSAPGTALAKPGPRSVIVLLSAPEAQALEDGMKADLLSAEKSVIEFAKKLDVFVRGEGWKARGYKGLTEWREKEMPFSEFYNARNVMKLLAAGVPAERIEKIPLTNINTMARQLPPSQWKDETILYDAERSPVVEFENRAKARSNQLGMNVEDAVRRGFEVPKSLADNWDLSLRIAKMVDGCKEFEACIEAIVSTYLNSNSEIPDKTRLQVYQENYAVEEKKAS